MQFDDLDGDLGYWISLTRVTGIGPSRFDLLINAFGSAKYAWAAEPGALMQAGLDRKTADALIVARHKVEPEREVENLRAFGGVAIARHHAGYPEQLAE